MTNLSDGWTSLSSLIAEEVKVFQIQVISSEKSALYPINRFQIWREGRSVRSVLVMKSIGQSSGRWPVWRSTGESPINPSSRLCRPHFWRRSTRRPERNVHERLRRHRHAQVRSRLQARSRAARNGGGYSVARRARALGRQSAAVEGLCADGRRAR